MKKFGHLIRLLRAGESLSLLPHTRNGTPSPHSPPHCTRGVQQLRDVRFGAGRCTSSKEGRPIFSRLLLLLEAEQTACCSARAESCSTAIPRRSSSGVCRSFFGWLSSEVLNLTIVLCRVLASPGVVCQWGRLAGAPTV